MATKIFCDRCNSDITSDRSISGNKVTLELEDQSAAVDKIYDLCKSCTRLFHDWMNPPKEK